MPRIVIILPDQPPQRYRFQLHREAVRLGRGLDNDITIECGSISANHAVMERIPGGYQLRDLGSTNGTKLDDTPRSLIPLSDGLRVRLGDVAFDFSLSQDEKTLLAAESPAPVRPPAVEDSRTHSTPSDAFTSGDDPPQPASPESAWQDQALQLKRNREQRAMRRLAWACAVTLMAILGGLEALSFLPKGPVAEPVVATAPVAKPPPSQPASPERPAEVAPPTAPSPLVTQPPPVAESSAREEVTELQPTAAERLAAEPELLLTGMDSQRDAAVARDRALLLRVIKGKAWDAYRTLLGKSLKAALAKQGQRRGANRYDPVWKEPVLYQALLRWKTLGWFSEAAISQLVTDSYTSPMFIWLLNNSAAMEELLLTLHANDDGGKVLKFLIDAWSMNEKKYEKYFPLAVACAVVFDRSMAIPNPVGKTSIGIETEVDPLKRYLWYVTNNERGKLAAPVHHSTARDLVWVVCAPVSTSELDWAINKLSRHRKNWGDTYGMVEYLMERAVNDLNPYKEYSFAEILKRGGVCGDRAYFCVNTARAQGIPAMAISGETDSGGHAWAGLKVKSDEWTTGVGRIGGASKGQAGNPQTGESLTEQEIQSWNDRDLQSALVTGTVWRHLWLADFYSASGNTADHAATVRAANQLGHSFTATWKALYALLERETEFTGDPSKPRNLDEWKNFAAAMRREFRDNPRMAEMATAAEDQYIFPYGEAGDARSALRLQRRKIDREAGEQKDIIATSLKREADLILKQGGPDAKRNIGNLYDRALRDYGGSITGFKMMAADYFAFFKDDPELARKAARDVELAFKRVVETGSKDWFRAQTEASIYQMICSYYRTAGDAARADQLEKRYELLLRRAKRSAR
ncbi:MAG: FHA domain-containing protein [Akkermansiaceae bacterium]|nr:FHA domain-containing protein [Akkermansiaceae bacterium]